MYSYWKLLVMEHMPGGDAGGVLCIKIAGMYFMHVHHRQCNMVVTSYVVFCCNSAAAGHT